MIIKGFRSKHFPDYEIFVGVSTYPKVPYISFERVGDIDSGGVVHFDTEKELEEFKEALKQAEKEAVFEEAKTKYEAKTLREHAKWCIKRAKELEKRD